MNDEVKEILDGMKKANNENCNLWLENVSVKLLYNYITNLQEENEDLKDRLKVMEHFKNSLLEENETYKTRCEKAIEFIKEEAGYDEEIRSCCCDLLYSDCDKLIELLSGDE